MSDRESLTPELKGVEAALASLVPTPVAAAERDRLMFAAGRAAAPRRTGGLRQLVTVAALAAAFGVGHWSSAPPAAESPVAAPVAAAPVVARPAIETPGPLSYVHLRRSLPEIDLALEHGGARPIADVDPPTRRELLRELLN